MDSPTGRTLSRSAAVPVVPAERIGGCVFPHPISALCTVGLLNGCVVIAAGGSAISAGLTSALLRPHPTASPPLETLHVSSGLVTCVSAAPLRGGAAALCAAGTSRGTLCVFIVEAGAAGAPPALFKLCDAPLCEYSEGRISASDALVDVRVGLDPAGRAEFICAASASALVLIDAPSIAAELRAAATEPVARAAAERHLRGASLRAASDAFCVFFAVAEIVRVLAPERLRAAFAMDIALVVVLDSGDVHFVERRVAGGSVQLLREHNEQRQARQSRVALSLLDETLLCEGNGKGKGKGEEDKDGARALAHVLYAYRLSPVVHMLCAGLPHVVLNDAALSYDAGAQQMRIIVAGAEAQQPEGAAGWWAIGENIIRPRDTLAAAPSAVTVASFAGPKGGGLPRDRRGIAAVLPIGDSDGDGDGDPLIFAVGNELHRGAVGEAAAGRGGGLRHVHTSGSAVSAVAKVREWDGGKPAVMLACGSSLAILAL